MSKCISSRSKIGSKVVKDPVYWSVPRNRTHDLLLWGQFKPALPTELILLRFYASFFIISIVTAVSGSSFLTLPDLSHYTAEENVKFWRSLFSMYSFLVIGSITGPIISKLTSKRISGLVVLICGNKSSYFKKTVRNSELKLIY